MRRELCNLCIAVLLIGAVAGRMASADGDAKPIPAGATARTSKDVQKAVLAHNDRVIAGTYKKIGKRDPRWDATAISFLNGYVQWSSGNQVDAAALVRLGRKAVEQGCDDLIVLTCLGVMQARCVNLREAEPLLQRAVDGLKKDARIPRDIARLAAIYLARIRERLDCDGQDAALHAIANKWTAQAQSDGSYSASESPIMVGLLYTAHADFFEGNVRSLYNAASSVQKPDKYFVTYLKGVAEISDGWGERGSEASRAVNEESSVRSGDHFVRARALLTTAWKLRPTSPEAPTAMIEMAGIGFGNERDTPRIWFDRAVAAQMDYPEAYDELEHAIRKLQDPCAPYASGVQRALRLYEFGEDCLNTKRFDTGVPLRFLQLLHGIEELTGSRNYWTAPQTKRHLEVMFAGYEKSGFLKGGDYYRSLHAAAAWYSGQNDTAKGLLTELGSRLQSNVFKDEFGVDYGAAKRLLDHGVVMGEMALNPENGHYYRIVKHPGKISWEGASQLARRVENKSLKGHLATVTSDSENEFINSLRLDDSQYWIGVWSAGGAWKWITGETPRISKFEKRDSPGAPADTAGTICADGHWGVENRNTLIDGYVVECE